MSEFYLDEVLTDVDESCESTENDQNNVRHVAAPEPHPAWMRHMGPAAAGSTRNSPRGTLRRNSCDYAAEASTASFLKTCGLCQRRLAPGRDIFMYRGEIAYCSVECRQQQMNQDELREKCALKSMSQPPSSGAADQSSNGAETVAAA